MSASFYLLFLLGILFQDQADFDLLIERLKSDDIKIKQEAHDNLVNSWKDDSIYEKLRVAFRQAEENKDYDFRARAQDVLDKMEFRRMLGEQLIKRFGKKLDETLYHCDESSSLEYLKTWLENPKPFGLDDKSRCNKVVRWLMGKFKNFQIKQKFIKFLASEPDGWLVEHEIIEGFSVKNVSKTASTDLDPDLEIGWIAEWLKDEDPIIRSASIEGLAKTIPRSSGSEYKICLGKIAQMLDDDDSRVRATSARSLGELHARQYEKQIADLLNDQEGLVRGAAAYSLAEMGFESYADTIAKLLLQEDANAQEQAILALGLISGRNSNLGKKYASSVAIFLKAKSSFLRSAAIKSLEAMKAAEYAAEISALLKTEDFDMNKEAVVKALVTFQQMTNDVADKYGNAVADLLTDKSLYVRKFALEGLVELRHEKATKKIASMLSDSDQINILLRSEILKALGKLYAKEHLKEIAALLDDPECAHKHDAVWAIGRLGGTEYIDKVVEFLSDKTIYMRGAAAFAVADLGAKDHAKDVARLLRDNDTWVKRCAIFSLAILKASEFAEDIFGLLSNQKLRDAAVYALTEMDAKEYKSLIEKYVDDKTEAHIYVGIEHLYKWASVGRLVSDALEKWKDK
ncbi:MAG: HEAT repeat domain-containing protein [Planctomycetes bacterium]|nr:HEAT repeat domain-containing protein [Planctomycetota bacterium]